jgi:zinc transporter ZupT
MALFCAVPLFSAGVRKHSRTLFLMGTGALFGICFFDLVPDVFALGGSSSLYIMGAVWLLYSVVHLFHLSHHHHPGEEGHTASHGFMLFFGSLLAHCFASGMLLTASQSLSDRIARTVFIALLIHKTYESLVLTSILIEQRRSAAWNFMLIGLYSLALPAGAFATQLFQASLTQSISMVVSSIAVGTLLGCLIFDFLIPSVRELRRQRFIFAWILLGLALTRLVMMSL